MIFRAFVSYLNLNASCLSWMNDRQHRSGRQIFWKILDFWDCTSVCFSSWFSISKGLKCEISLNCFSREMFSSLVIEYFIFLRVLFLKSMANKIFRDSSWIMLSLISRCLMLMFMVKAEQICWRPLGPIRLFWRFRTSMVVVSSIREQISIAPLFPNLLSVKSKILSSW